MKVGEHDLHCCPRNTVIKGEQRTGFVAYNLFFSNHISNDKVISS